MQNLKRSVKRIVRSEVAPQTAIVRVAPVPEKPWEIQGEQLTILKNAICKGASDTELQYCLTVAKRYKLDPFKRQIWFVPRWDSQADNGKGGKGGNVWIPTVGIDGLTFMAARDHGHDFGSIGEPEFGPMLKVGTIQAPEWARVKVFKKGTNEPTTCVAYWEEYAPDVEKKNQYGSYVAPFWRKMPRRMISKCATALAIRQAYPDLGGVYIPEETERMGEEHTESGRQIVSGVPTGGSREAAQAVAQRIIADAHGANMSHAADSKPPSAAPQKQAQDAPQVPQDLPIITIDLTHEASPIVTGDSTAFEALFSAYCKWQSDGFWHTEPRHVERFREAQRLAHAFKLVEIMPKVSPKSVSKTEAGKGALQPKAGAPSPAQGASAPTSSGKEEATSAARVSPSASPEPQIVACTIERVNTGMAGKNPVKHVTVLLSDRTKPTYSCFDKKWFEALDAGLGKVARLITKQNKGYTNIIGALAIGAKEWLEDGTPVVQRNREAGSPTLFGK